MRENRKEMNFLFFLTTGAELIGFSLFVVIHEDLQVPHFGGLPSSAADAMHVAR